MLLCPYALMPRRGIMGIMGIRQKGTMVADARWPASTNK
ncbi:MAG: hypothetical protein AVDCRST_MAG96-714 [uncultured Segetibacter sp.]|uniref:Uncharacterized protein n=1 Tax=uncultured Segetibacter sp. TaxID=481133 RepID=A0A6J4RU17_9BACT|nr:MAG: hypothetical protein AVDCRST_MAG96-714 [uncultured Segetibacter sp.]